MSNIPIPNHITNIIDDIRGSIGRLVGFTVLDSTTPCPVCTLDPVTDTSTDSFCPVCSGVYYIKVVSEVTVSGHVTWKDADRVAYYSAGTVMEGDARVQIKYSTKNLDIIDRTEFVTLDSRKMQIQTVTPLGVPELNRIAISLIEEEKNE